MTDYQADIAIIGAGLGGVAAALGALRSGRSVILTEEYEWIGGQMTSQAVPSDEHSWIEHIGGSQSFRNLRTAIRQFYRDHYPLNEGARNWQDLNPGSGWVSRMCVEPRVPLMVMEAWLAPYIGMGRLKLLKPYRPASAETTGDRVTSVTLKHRQSGDQITVAAAYIIDATELHRMRCRPTTRGFRISKLCCTGRASKSAGPISEVTDTAPIHPLEEDEEMKLHAILLSTAALTVATTAQAQDLRMTIWSANEAHLATLNEIPSDYTAQNPACSFMTDRRTSSSRVSSALPR